MKPTYLEMNYFGPHEKSIVDFRLLDESPIFLISGDTGAGKSTIFDAMTYALFGTTTGDRDAKEMRSQFATPDNLTSVVFYFEQGDLLYKIERKPEQNIAKKRGSGTTIFKATAKLAIVDRVAGIEKANIATIPKNVGEEITRLLHLNAEQFKKIILLPQNDFSRFLKSSTSEKESILKKIFGTSIFTAFSNAIKLQNSEINAIFAEYERKLQSYYESQIWNSFELERLEVVPEHEKFNEMLLLKEERTKVKEETISKNLEQKEKVTLLEDSYKIALNLYNDFKNLSKLESDYQEKIIEQSQSYNKNLKHFEELTWAQPLKQSLHELEQDKKRSKDLEIKITDMTTKTLTEEKLLQNLLTENEHLSEQQQRINDQKSESESLITQIQQAFEDEKKQAKIVDLRNKQSETQQSLKNSKDVLIEFNQEILKLRENIISDSYFSEKKEEINQLKLTFQGKLLPDFQRISWLEKENLDLSNKLESTKKEQSENKKHLNDVQMAHEEKIKGRRRLMIAQLQAELEENEPCPVCGALEHPSVDEIENISYEKLGILLKEIDESQKLLATLLEKNKQLNQLTPEITNNLVSKSAEKEQAIKNFSLLYREFISNYSDIFPSAFDEFVIEGLIQNLESALIKEEAENNQLKIKLTDLEGKYLGLQEEVKKLENTYLEFSTQIENLLTEIRDSAVTQTSEYLQDKRNKLKEEIALFEKRLADLTSKISEIKISVATKKANLKSLNIQLIDLSERIKNNQDKIDKTLLQPEALTTDFQVLWEWANDDKWLELSQKVEQYKSEKSRLEQEIESLHKKLQNKARPNLEEIENRKKQETDLYLSLQKKLAADETAEQQAIVILSEVRKLMKGQEKQFEKRKAIGQLYGAISGKLSEDKLRLETFVVQNYLEKILDYANIHFINQLSNNRYRFELSEEGNNRRMDHGLDINIYDNETGASRSADTLSGGETFIAALSIALALSEVVQNTANGVQIEALFIDEGFGSLDQETLQKAMQALEQIGKNRLVGVISHVEEMKSTIGQQIIIKKVGDGRSKVKSVIK
ncbi:SbcC/MukB-like Walker B domain-containing protein [Lactococcus cremoris]|uniref:Nuclease SbcCD subunit C n=1 Tax=Lactococcus lactis subsp. cremoris TaxID=1359 RepID=A0A1V0PHN8_LACLC|nr:SMC family ATPase [Lactococcus cremoris]ARE28743.1 SMC family ATPase [Lactococcus cremoris]EUN35131.1 exonuclease SbcC [Lactococcus cremoris subsp. cremoris HP]KZK11386.1 Exonuclease SbcC [Lactococcus cremoris]KZK34373.1 Exonuclease SbcC [Lactococcus cremoris]KZK44125.1 Exonuclease SbcC [Lactococcus cremoris]